MADATKIEWTDATWNPITGCSVISPGYPPSHFKIKSRGFQRPAYPDLPEVEG